MNNYRAHHCPKCLIGWFVFADIMYQMYGENWEYVNTSSAHFLKDEIDKYFDGKPLKHYRDFKSKLISIDISEDDIAMLRKSGKFSNLILKYFP